MPNLVLSFGIYICSAGLKPRRSDPEGSRYMLYRHSAMTGAVLSTVTSSRLTALITESIF